MSNGTNMVILKGEPYYAELKYTGGGKALYKAKLKINNPDQHSGEERSNFLRITAWEDYAEYLNSLPRGTCVRVSGRIQERSFEKDGQKRNITDIVVDGVAVEEGTTGENYFTLEGQLMWPDFKQVGERQTSLFRAKVKVPFTKQDGTPGNQYVRITAWDDMADGLRALREGAPVKVSGHIQDRTWTDPAGEKRVFTDAVVTNFTSGS